MSISMYEDVFGGLEDSDNLEIVLVFGGDNENVDSMEFPVEDVGWISGPTGNTVFLSAGSSQSVENLQEMIGEMDSNKEILDLIKNSIEFNDATIKRLHLMITQLRHLNDATLDMLLNEYMP